MIVDSEAGIRATRSSEIDFQKAKDLDPDVENKPF